MDSTSNVKKDPARDPLRGFGKEALRSVERSEYFVVQGPSRSGKTAFLRAFAESLKREREGAYIVLCVPFGDLRGEALSPEAVAEAVLERLYAAAESLPAAERPPEQRGESLLEALCAWSRAQEKPVVLLFDDVDALHGMGLVYFLREIRVGFMNFRHAGSFPISIAFTTRQRLNPLIWQALPPDAPDNWHGFFNYTADTYLLAP